MTRDEWLQEYYAFCEKVEKAREAYKSGLCQKPTNVKDQLKLSDEYLIAIYYPYPPTKYPPCGCEMPVEVFCEFLSKWPEFHLPQYAWCASGKEMHDRVRLSYKYGTLGVSTPREGYYKIIGESEVITDVNRRTSILYHAYYNRYEPVFAEFESQIVKIKSATFYNKASIRLGNNNKGIATGDVIHVTKRTELVETIFEGETSKSYSVTWEIL